MAEYGYSEGNPEDTAASQAFAPIVPRNNDAALFVGGLSFSANEEDLRRAFGSIGTIVSVRIVEDRDTGKPRGFAFVNFESAENVDAAIQKCQGMELCGRNVRLDRSAAGVGNRSFGKGKGFVNMVPAYPIGNEYGMYGGGYHRPHGGPGHYQMMSPFGQMPAYAPHPGYPYPIAVPLWQQQQHIGQSHTAGSGGAPHPPPAPPAFTNPPPPVPPAVSSNGSSGQ